MMRHKSRGDEAGAHEIEHTPRDLCRIAAHDGTEIHIEAQSICVHGDSPGAVTMAREIRDLFQAEAINIRAFAGTV